MMTKTHELILIKAPSTKPVEEVQNMACMEAKRKLKTHLFLDVDWLKYKEEVKGWVVAIRIPKTGPRTPWSLDR